MNAKERRILKSICDDIDDSDDKIDALERLYFKVKEMVSIRTTNHSKKLKILERFNIIDYCIENFYHLEPGGGVYLADAFKKLHDKFGWKYQDIHSKFYQEVKERWKDVYITRTSDIFVKGAMRKQLPIYNNQWYSHLMKKH